MQIQSIRCAAAVLLCSASFAMAAQRSWVASSGDDVGTCNRAAPCKTFRYAITQTPAGGEIAVVDAGGYNDFVIDKSITIGGPAGQVANINAQNGGTAITIDAPADARIVLRNITVNGLGQSGAIGVQILSAGQVYIDQVSATGFATAGMAVTPTANPVSVVIEHSTLVQNAVGLLVNASGAAAAARLSNTTVQQNTTGLKTESGGAITSFNNNRLNGNTTDGAPTLNVFQR